MVKQEFTIYIGGKILERGIRLDENEYAIYGDLQKGVTGDETIQVEYKLMDKEDDEGWEQQEFTVPAENTSFQFSLKELRRIQDGKEYAVRIRYFQRWYTSGI